MTKMSIPEAIERYASESRRLAQSIDSCEDLQAGAKILLNTILEMMVEGVDDMALIRVMMSGAVSMGAVSAMERIATELNSDHFSELCLTVLNERVTIYTRVAERILSGIDRPFLDAATRWPNLFWEVQA